MNEKGSATGITFALIALIIAALALVLSWIAYNRTGEDLDRKIQEQVNQSVQSIEQGAQEGAQELDENTEELRQDASDAIEPNGDNTTNDPDQPTTNDSTTNQ